MAERLLDRTFNALAAQADGGGAGTGVPRPRTQQDDEDELRRVGAPMDVQDAIARILLAFKDKDFFRLMELPSPDMDELGRPWWCGTSADVSKAYRRLSILVHPDKNPGPDARAAFEALNKAHRELKDAGSRRTIERLVPNLGQGAGWVEMPHASPSCGAPPGGAPNPWAGGRQEEQVKAGADAGRRRREAAEAAATPEERVLLFAARKDRMRELKKQEGDSFQAVIAQQVREKQDRAKRKRDMVARCRRQDAEDDAGEGEEAAGEAARSAQARRGDAKGRKGKPRLIF